MLVYSDYIYFFIFVFNKIVVNFVIFLFFTLLL